ncbi:MAG: glycosyltransferase, partial [Candidatus Methanomethylicaceae archaeon]
VFAAITGDGEEKYRQHLHQLVRELGVDDCVRFLGTVEDMPAFYRACDVICIPSRSEPFGRTAIEAMAVGTPVVATKVGGLAETIGDAESGLLVRYGDRGHLAQCLVLTIIDQSLRQALTEQASLAVRQHFSSSVFFDSFARLLEPKAKSQTRRR